MVIYTESVDGGRVRWTSVPVSDVGQLMNETHVESSECIFCDQMADRKSLIQGTGTDGEERIATATTCYEHTGQWQWEDVKQGYLWRNDG